MDTLKKELTEAEKAMFRGLGWEHLFDTNITAPGLYRMAVEKAFVDGVKNKYVEALRVSARRLFSSQYRGNVEHDNVILYAINNYIP